ncbi:MlaD family protein [Mycolicibacterium fortuitum]|nr:MlaD family protein [Mycolicibacterium fortuitum]
MTMATVSCGSEGRDNAAAYCADVPDTVGLYVGNKVTQMGYPIGTISAITPTPTHVRVEFDLTEQRAIPSEVKAVIRSASILADRSLELVGNYDGGPRLDPGGCIPLNRSLSPKSLSEVIGSADLFLNAVNESGSANIADTVRGVDQLAAGNGAGAAQLLASSSALLDSPDQAIGDIGSIIQNSAELTEMLTEMREPIKGILMDAPTAIDDVSQAMLGAGRMAGPEGYGTLGPLIETVATLETRLGDETQLTLDAVSATVRKVSPHANAFAHLFNPVPWWINSVANHYNAHQFSPFNIAYRPPLFRVRTHNGLALCGFMNASVPGSCADVNGQPFAVDVALLQYVLQEASRR